MPNATTEDVLNNLGLLEDNGNLKAAALLLFTKNPKRYFPGVEFKIGRFHTTESDLIIQDAIGGNILQMPEKVIEALKSKYLVSPIHYEGMQRIEALEMSESQSNGAQWKKSLLPAMVNSMMAVRVAVAMAVRVAVAIAVTKGVSVEALLPPKLSLKDKKL